MDELFDKIKDGASKAKDVAEKMAKKAAKHTSNAITSTKLSYSINEAKGHITDIYAEIGKTVYEKYRNDGAVDSEFASEFEKISTLMNDIEELQAKKAELKNMVHCDCCDTVNPSSSEYCSKCGAKLNTCDDEFVEDDDDTEEVITITPSNDNNED